MEKRKWKLCLCVICFCCEWISKSMRYGKLQSTPLLFTSYSIAVGKYLCRRFRGLKSIFFSKTPHQMKSERATGPVNTLVKWRCVYKRLFPLCKGRWRVNLTPDLRLKPNIKYSRKFSFSYWYYVSMSRSTRDSLAVCCPWRRVMLPSETFQLRKLPSAVILAKPR
jgi:hypothetical protein